MYQYRMYYTAPYFDVLLELRTRLCVKQFPANSNEEAKVIADTIIKEKIEKEKIGYAFHSMFRKEGEKSTQVV